MKSTKILLILVLSFLLSNCVSTNGLQNRKFLHKNHAKYHEVDSDGLYAYK